MQTQNLLTLHFKKRETALKWLVGSFAYCALFMFLENPADKTISLIGREHLILFCLYCFLCGAAMIINFQYCFSRFRIRNRFLYGLMMVSNLCLGLVATTLMPPLSANGEISVFATVVHWITGFGNILVNATVALILNLKVYKAHNSKKAKILFITGTSICIADLLVFLLLTLISGDPQKAKNGFFEIIPIFVTYLVLYVMNHTDTVSDRRERDLAEKEYKADDSRIFSAVSFALLMATVIFFNHYAFIRNPIHYTISMTGIDYPGGFNFVCVLFAASFACNFIMLFKKYGYKNIFVYGLAMIGSLSIVLCAAFPTTMNKDIDVLHAAGALIFFFFSMAAIMFFMLSRAKKSRKHRGFLLGMTAIVVAVIITLIVLFIILDQRYGRTGLTEIVPLEYIFAYFYLENFTDYFEREGKKKTAKKGKVTA
ncbi:MAG: hypothetical protein PUB43_03180 [Oscillospiraceae bacterium]|nr:hypothetical protein [Oscillospiraceae bacterium]